MPKLNPNHPVTQQLTDAAMISVTTTRATKGTDNPLRDQTRAIQQQHDKLPPARNETPREARWRVEREKATEQAKREPHKGY